MTYVPARASTLDSLIILPEVPSTQKATLLHEASPDRQLAAPRATIKTLPGSLGTWLSWAGPQCPHLGPHAFGFVGRSVYAEILVAERSPIRSRERITALCDMSQVLWHTI